ncbi:MAG TPA: DUF433 domain-containing protein [Longimicrobium sp.]|nr:DUF433 domain-containing protein [Longimicrobium sp.]
MARFELYGGRDPRQLPAYSVGEAARYLRIPSATLRSWVAGRTYPRQDGVGSFEPVIRPADTERRRLSFENLVEAHVLRALRTDHSIHLSEVRPALAYAEAELGIQRLLLNHQQLMTHGGELFLDRFGELVNLSRSGQIAMRSLLLEHLKRVDLDDAHIPIRLYPFLASGINTGRSVVIDPRRSFGHPVLAGAGIRTQVVVDRINAGESVEDLAKDYELSEDEIREALIFHQTAA